MDFSQYSNEELKIEFQTAVQNHIYQVRKRPLNYIGMPTTPHVSELICTILTELKQWSFSMN